MFSGQQPGWGIILLGLWGIGALGWFLKSQTWREQALHPRLVQGLLFLCLLLALMDPKIMYSQIAPANPALLSKGPIQIFPKTTMIYLQATLILSLGLLAMTILIRGKLQAWQRTIGILLVALAACSHLLVFRIVPFPLIDVFTTLSEACVALLEGRNPYGMTYTDIYQGQGLTPTFFGYLPGIFPWAISGSLLGGDVRMGNFLALAGTSLIFLCGNHGQSFLTRCLCACLLFYGGAGLFVAEQAWIDPVLLFLIVAAACCLEQNHEVLAGCLAGLLCATKQYGVVAFVFLWLMLISNAHQPKQYTRIPEVYCVRTRYRFFSPNSFLDMELSSLLENRCCGGRSIAFTSRCLHLGFPGFIKGNSRGWNSMDRSRIILFARLEIVEQKINRSSGVLFLHRVGLSLDLPYKSPRLLQLLPTCFSSVSLLRCFGKSSPYGKDFVIQFTS
ncbi:MAG: DUF2029 domain-containing protein [Bacteroidetes bacterium]|nr:DUF2029 domain-containing protein [Bacteroidota bacterium]